MSECPCRDCPHRKLVCHDHCGEYRQYHDELVVARAEVKKARDAYDFLLDAFLKREKYAHRRKPR